MTKPLMTADYARQYWLRTSMVYGTLLYTINEIVAGHGLEENEDPTRIERPDGTSIQPLKHTAEPIHAIRDPGKFILGKLAFGPRALNTMLLETQWPGGPPLKDKTIAGKAAVIGESMLPFQAGAAINAPEGDGVKRAVGSTLGILEYGQPQNPATVAKRREDKRFERRRAEEKRRRKELDRELGRSK